MSELGNHGEPIVVLARDLCVMEGAEWSGLLWRSHFCLGILDASVPPLSALRTAKSSTIPASLRAMQCRKQTRRLSHRRAKKGHLACRQALLGEELQWQPRAGRGLRKGGEP